VVVFPGGEPTLTSTLTGEVIDFEGAPDSGAGDQTAGVPIVAAVASAVRKAATCPAGWDCAKARGGQLMRVKSCDLVGLAVRAVRRCCRSTYRSDQGVMQVSNDRRALQSARSRHRRRATPPSVRVMQKASRAAKENSSLRSWLRRPPGHSSVCWAQWPRGIVAPRRPAKYLRIIAVDRRDGPCCHQAVRMSAQRCPIVPALVDELAPESRQPISARRCMAEGVAGFTAERRKCCIMVATTAVSASR